MHGPKSLPDAEILQRLKKRLRERAKSDPVSGCIEYTGCTTAAGYGVIRIRKTNYYVHRVIWALAHGPIPCGMVIDHKCGNRSCFNLDHLHVVTQSENNENKTVLGSNNTSGYRGVYWSKAAGKWCVEAMVRHKKYYGGLFDSLEEAGIAALELRNKIMMNNLNDAKLMRLAGK